MPNTERKFTAGTTVNFTARFLADLIGQCAADVEGYAAELRARSARGLIVQGYPRPGRVNVKYVGPEGFTHYRTFAERDLVAA